MSKRFILTISTILIILIGTSIAVFLAKGYTFSTDKGVISGTGIISVTSIPDQASVYLDDHLTTATNANINAVLPKSYNVKIVKDGFIPWEKKVEVKEGLVTNVKATLFRKIPTIYPLTYNGAQKLSISPDGQNLLYVVPGSTKKSGLWVWNMSEQAIGFSRSSEPHQIANYVTNIDYTAANFRWSPDSKQILVSLPNQTLLLDKDRLNDPPQDITAILKATTNVWDSDQKDKNLTKLESIKDPVLKNIASNSAQIKWSPDETKFFVSDQNSKVTTVYSVIENKSYLLSNTKDLNWLPDSNHLITVEEENQPSPSPTQNNQVSDQSQVNFPMAKISIIEIDGSNKSEIYAGNFDPSSVFAWPDSSRLVIISSVPTITARDPNLYGINLK